jgi:NAD+ kinase
MSPHVSELSSDQIHQYLDSLAKPPGSLGRLEELAARLCSIQGTLAPITTPRRLIVFAADRGTTPAETISQMIQAVVSGGSASSVLAKSTNSDLVLVDIGSPAEILPDAPNYRARKVRHDHHPGTRPSPITPDEFHAAFVVGQREAERANNDGMRLIAAGELESYNQDPSTILALIDQPAPVDSDPMRRLAHLPLGIEVAAIAGLYARAGELDLTIVLEGPISLAAALVANYLQPETSLNIIAAHGGKTAAHSAALHKLGVAPLLNEWNIQHGEGVGALLVFPLLDSAAAIASNMPSRPAAEQTPNTFLAAEPKRTRRIAVFTGTFDPPTAYHRHVAQMVREKGFDEVVVRPTAPRPKQKEDEHAAPIHRAVMVDLAFRDLPGVSVDLDDLDEGRFLDDSELSPLYADRGEVWHITSADFVTGGREGTSIIQTRWETGAELWKSGRFLILHPGDSPPDPADLPPVHQLLVADDHVPTADIRIRIFLGGDVGTEVPDGVASYIRRYGLFSDFPPPRETQFKLDDPRLMIVADEANPKARALKEQYRHLESTDPNAILVLGGDGTMLATIRKHWRKRLPFLGLNAGHLGFLMNEMLPTDLTGTRLVVYRMPMLRVDTEAPDGHITRSLAFADAWLERNSGQASWLQVDVDGRMPVPKVVGDGLLVATPSGSSAYARAMGATPVPLTAPVLTMSGSNVFRPRFWKPVALPDSAVVKLTNLDKSGKRMVRGFLDGRSMGVVSSMEVRASSIAAVELAFTPQFDLSARLLRSLFPPSEGDI